MLERTTIFVDTSYLLASFYNSWETGARSQLEIDLPAVVSHLSELVENHLHQPVHRQYWYDGIPESGPHRYQRALRTCDGVHLRAGQLIEWGERRTQKAVDTRLVADMIVTSMRNQVSDMVLVSGDADMIPGVEEAVAHGARVHLYGFGWDSMSAALRHVCDSTTILDPREDFGSAMQIEVLEGPLPPVIRSKPLGDAMPPETPGTTPIPDSSLTSTTLPPEVTFRDATIGEDPVNAPDFSETVIPSAHPTPATDTATPSTDAITTAENTAVPPVTPVVTEFAEAQEDRTVTTFPANNTPAAKLARDVEAGAGEVASAGGVAAAAEPVVAEPVVAEPVVAAQPAETVAETVVEEEEEVVQQVLRVREEIVVTAEAEVIEKPKPKPAPKPSMMAQKRKLRSRYVPLPNEVWASAGFQTPFDVGQQYASWWYENAATQDQRDKAHLLSGGGLPSEIDRPLLQFACETLHEYTLTETQRVNLRDGFHAGIRGLLLSLKRDN
ncbi:NYN domain-containing protein [Corynebacterium caspium]|uniref:NYN domain-containing protein n=1 Tax=Corynebacterium caspium TaxID=234828 RepID=UPI00036E33DA|nr:NYN domain-containing protein [Corynebacterium caspium]WKD60019.1 NYN domain protein [Corynebacterium caspium DSM 44850]